MKKALIAVGVLLVVVSGFAGYGGAVAAQHSRIQNLESENAQLKGRLDNIQDLVTEAKDGLDDVEDEVQSDESCEDTDAYSDAADVEDKLNEIDSEASTEGPRDHRAPVPIALRWRAPFSVLSHHRRGLKLPIVALCWCNWSCRQRWVRAGGMPAGLLFYQCPKACSHGTQKVANAGKNEQNQEPHCEEQLSSQ